MPHIPVEPKTSHTRISKCFKRFQNDLKIHLVILLMPRTNIDYSETVIYKIEHDIKKELLFIGSTTAFTQRKSKHKKLALCDHPTWKDSNTNLYKAIRENGGWKSFKMIEIRKYPCNDIKEANAKIHKYICKLNATLNMTHL